MRKHDSIDAASGATPAFERRSRLRRAGGADGVLDGADTGSSAGGAPPDAVADAAGGPSCDEESDGGRSVSLVDGSNATEDEVQDLIDAVAGATWNTRNRIMEERFLADLDRAGGAKVPAFKPPGEAILGE